MSAMIAIICIMPCSNFSASAGLLVAVRSEMGWRGLYQTVRLEIHLKAVFDSRVGEERVRVAIRTPAVGSLEGVEVLCIPFS